MRVKKLSLHRETVRRLEPAELRRAAGGADKSGLCTYLTNRFLVCGDTNACPTRVACPTVEDSQVYCN